MYFIFFLRNVNAGHKMFAHFTISSEAPCNSSRLVYTFFKRNTPHYFQTPDNTLLFFYQDLPHQFLFIKSEIRNIHSILFRCNPNVLIMNFLLAAILRKRSTKHSRVRKKWTFYEQKKVKIWRDEIIEIKKTIYCMGEVSGELLTMCL